MSAVPSSRTSPPPGGHVVVVGTGVVGLSAALGCAQRGLAVTLLGPVPAGAAARTESAPGSAWDARIYALSPATVRFLEQQRVWPQVDASRVCAVQRMDVHGDDGGRLEFDARATGAQCLASICEESQLLRALWLACTLAPGIAHRARGFDSAVFGTDGAGRTTVQVRLDDGAVLAADLLVGADGRQSAVRAAAGIGARQGDYGQTAVVANFTTHLPHGGVARQWFTQEGVLALLPLPGSRVSLVWSAPHGLLAELLALSPEDFARRVARRAGDALGAMELIGERHAFVLHRVVVERLARGGAVLLGDAAHVVHPLAGQGLNLGLQDVSEFLRVLDARESWRGLGDPVWLRRYERARAEPIALMRATVDGLARLFNAPDDRLRRLRNVGMSALDVLAPLKQALVRHAMG
jgi:ubiquinone biosynthesis UbiH/UbiF/VisC/COQ6 family hydroxylase